MLQFDDFSRDGDRNIYSLATDKCFSVNSTDGTSKIEISGSDVKITDKSTGAQKSESIGGYKSSTKSNPELEELRSRLFAKGIRNKDFGLGEWMSILFTGEHPFERISDNPFSMKITAVQNPVEEVEPISIDVDFNSLNENLQKANLRTMTLEEFENKYLGSVVLSRRGADQLELKSNSGFNFSNGVVFSEKYFNETFAVGSVVGPVGNSWSGAMSTANSNGLTTLMGSIEGLNPDNGYNIIFNGANLGTMSTINSESAGTSSTFGSNGQLNTTSGTFAGESTGGAHMTFDADGTLGAYMWTRGDGSSQMGADQFIMSTAAPGRADEIANYAAPVGGESATYDRGTAKLVNGEATVICPESFRWIADQASMTVTITPLSADSKGIAVIEKTAGGFKVKELHGGKGDYQFDYLVMAKRKGQENYEVVRPRPQLMTDHSRDLKIKAPTGPIKSIRDLFKNDD